MKQIKPIQPRNATHAKKLGFKQVPGAHLYWVLAGTDSWKIGAIWFAGRTWYTGEPEIERTAPARFLNCYVSNRGHPLVSLTNNAGKRWVKQLGRFIWEAYKGPFPRGKICCHVKNDPLDNRLSNLYLGTPKTNQRDRRKDGTDNSGERCSHAKLTWKIVHRIRALWATDKYVQQALADKFGTTRDAVCRIVSNKTWKEQWLT